MILHISSYGVGSVFNVDFDRTDIEALDAFLISESIFASDRQIKLFATKGECVEFTRSRGKTVVKTIVMDITESERNMAWRKKARGIAERWSHNKNTNRLINILIKFDVGSDAERVRKAVRLQDKWNAKVEKLVAQLDSM